MRFATPQGFNSGDQFFTYLKDSFDTLYAEGKAGRPRMMSIGLHCRLVGRPGRAAALQALHRLREGPRQGLARPPHRHRPPLAARRIPIRRRRCARRRMDRDAFVAQLRRHLRAFALDRRARLELELGPAHDTAGGLHNALCRVFRSASETERLGVLNAHPDLAGKLAAGQAPDRGIDQRTGLRRPRRADRRRARALHQAQRRLCHELRLPLHHRGQGQDQGRDPRRLRDAASATTAPPNSPPPAGRSSASRCSGCRTCCPHEDESACPAAHYYAPHGGLPPQTRAADRPRRLHRGLCRHPARA